MPSPSDPLHDLRTMLDPRAPLPPRSEAAWDALWDGAIADDVIWWGARAIARSDAPERATAAATTLVREQAASALAGTQQLLELTRALDAAGVAAVAYKGPALALAVHGDLGARRFDDLDLLIAPHEAPRAIDALEAIGYRAPHGWSRAEEQVFGRWEGAWHRTRNSGDRPLELHWRCQAPRYGGLQRTESVIARAEWLAVGGGRVRVPDPVTLAVLLAQHGAKHEWRSVGWIVDFHAALAGSRVEHGALAAAAARSGTRSVLGYALAVRSAVLGAAAPPEFARDAARFTAEAARVVERVRIGIVLPPPPRRWPPRWLGGRTAQLRYLWYAATLPTPQERGRDAWPAERLKWAPLLRVKNVLTRRSQ
ncbi:MAG: nucleotidyltransferase family protein [Gemmatimonadaceae bacterium]|nr:nucleotidyltransferase family protein [Gemmatimonadaceae bacterium]